MLTAIRHTIGRWYHDHKWVFRLCFNGDCDKRIVMDGIRPLLIAGRGDSTHTHLHTQLYTHLYTHLYVHTHTSTYTPTPTYTPLHTYTSTLTYQGYTALANQSPPCSQLTPRILLIIITVGLESAYRILPLMRYEHISEQGILEHELPPLLYT